MLKQLSVITLALALAGCVKAPGPIQYIPPQQTIARAVAVIANAADVAVAIAAAARDQGTISQADFGAVQEFAKAIVRAGNDIDTEIHSADPWATQEWKIRLILETAALGESKKHISAGAQVWVVGLVAIANQITLAIGARGI